jgi:hypothetical protein
MRFHVKIAPVLKRPVEAATAAAAATTALASSPDRRSDAATAAAVGASGSDSGSGSGSDCLSSGGGSDSDGSDSVATSAEPPVDAGAGYQQQILAALRELRAGMRDFRAGMRALDAHLSVLETAAARDCAVQGAAAAVERRSCAAAADLEVSLAYAQAHAEEIRRLSTKELMIAALLSRALGRTGVNDVRTSRCGRHFVHALLRMIMGL